MIREGSEHDERGYESPIRVIVASWDRSSKNRPREREPLAAVIVRQATWEDTVRRISRGSKAAGNGRSICTLLLGGGCCRCTSEEEDSAGYSRATALLSLGSLHHGVHAYSN